jgi:Protein of unknown function (DUF3987)
MPLDESSDQTATSWPEIDRSLLEETRLPPVPFPLELLPDRWRTWVERSAQVFTPVDYYAQGLLGAVAAACGGGIVVRVTPQWAEPLLLWQALVGPSSSGKSPALAAARRLVHGIAVEDKPEPAAGPQADPLLALLAPSPQAATQWREDLVERLGQVRRNLDLADWLAGWDGAQGRAKAPVDCDIAAARSRRNIMGGLAPDALAEVFGQRGEALAARFLYAWPEPPARAALSAEPADDDGVRGMLRRILGIGGTLAEPGTIDFEAEAIARFEQLLPLVRQRWRDAEGWKAAWLGKGAGMIVRLAGLLTLMHWAQDPKDDVPQEGVTAPRLEEAYALWADYFHPHAQSVFQGGGRGDRDGPARRAARWLRRAGLDQISREDIRRDALHRSADAEGTDQVIERLEAGGVLRPVAPRNNLGRPRRRWEVNPDLR